MTTFAKEQRDAFQPVLAALSKFPADHGVPGLLVVRPGYRYESRPVDGGSRTVATPAIVLAVTPKQLDAAGPLGPELEKQLNVPVEVQEASLDEQRDAFDPSRRSFGLPQQPTRSPFEAALRGQAPAAPPVFAAPKPLRYTPPPHLTLPRVKERMQLTVCASPESGWPVLEAFLGRVESTLTIGMYEFTAPHIAEAVTGAAGRIGGDVILTLHPVPEAPPRTGVKSGDHPEAAVIDSLQKAAEARLGFQWAPVGKDGVFASAYHIKVAVADSRLTWLSSGNWQSSNQPGPAVLDDKPARFQHDYNRDYHAVIANPTIATAYEKYLKYDFDLSQKHPHAVPNKWEGIDVVVPDGYRPPRFREAPQFFPPLALDRVVDVQLLLTPDNYAEKIFELLDSAEKTIDFQNQYINLNADQNHPEFERLVDALVAKQKAGVKVRVICRDMMTSDKLDLLVAKGFDPDFVKFQPACHNKCIIVDNATIAFGSHNWSNDGAVTNRDASLIFYDAEIAKYFSQIYEYDWDRLATAEPARPKKRTRIADAGDETNDGSASTLDG
jgi:hypothetical protein